jgi:hypothetical protein
VYFSSLDTATNRLTLKKVTSGPACCPGEDRPFCFMADKDQVFYYEYVGSKEKMERQATWLYNVKSNTFVDLKPKRQPCASPRTVEYIDGQEAVFAIIGDGQNGSTPSGTTPGLRLHWKPTPRWALPRPMHRLSTPPGTACLSMWDRTVAARRLCALIFEGSKSDEGQDQAFNNSELWCIIAERQIIDMGRT